MSLMPQNMVICDCANIRITPLPHVPVDPFTRYPDNPLPLFPTDTDLAHMANIEYSLNPNVSCLHSCNEKLLPGKIKAKLQEKCSYLLGKGWRLLATFQKSGKALQGYCGSAFFNVHYQQLVIVHRGTDSLLSTAADVLAVFRKNLNDWTGFAHSACWFTNEIVKKYGAGARSVTVTGHSLGGWLAQASTFLTKYPHYISNDVIQSLNGSQVKILVGNGNLPEAKEGRDHLHCVCFDSPGFLEAIEKTIPKLGKLHKDRLHKHRYLDSLDVTVYLADCFTVGNFCHNQIGSVFVMQNVQTHSSDAIVKFWLEYYDEEGRSGEGAGIREVNEQQSWRKNADTIPMNVLEFRASVFTEIELEKCKTVDYIKKNLGTEEWLKQFPGQKFLSQDFEFRYDFQIVDIAKLFKGQRHRMTDLVAFRDYFIQSMKFHLDRFSGVKFQEWCIRVNCQQYTHSLLAFEGSLEFSELSELVKVTQKLQVLNTPAGKEFVVASQVYHGLKFTARDDSKWFYLDVDTLWRLNQTLDGFNSEASKLAKELVVIVGKSDLHAHLIKDFLTGLCQNELTKKIILIVSKDLGLRIRDYIGEQGVLSFDNVDEKDIPEEKTLVRFTSLSNIGKEALKDLRIMFKGTRIELGSLTSDFSSFSDISDFFQAETTFVGSALPALNEFEESYFIERKFRNVVLSAEGLAALHDHIILSCNDDTNLIKLTKGVPFFIWGNGVEYLDEKFIIVPCTSNVSFSDVKDFIRHEQLKAHWFRVEVDEQGDGKTSFVWLNSFGFDVKNEYFEQLNNLIDRNGRDFTFEEILRPDSELRIIADNPGKGKSIIMRKLATLAQQADSNGCPRPWTIFVDLSKSKVALRKLRSSPMNFDTVLEFISRFEAGNLGVEHTKCLLRSIIHQNLRVKLFLDSYDEIPHDLQETVRYLVHQLRDKSSVQVFLASRTYMQNQLEEYFRHFALQMLDLDDKEQVEFLVSFWTNHPDFGQQKFNLSLTDVDEVKANASLFAEKLLQKFIDEIGDAALKLIGVPLQLYMLAQISLTDHLFKYLESVAITGDQLQLQDVEVGPFLPNFSNTFDFYEMFIQEKLRIALEEKYRITGENDHAIVRKSVLRDMHDMHTKSAFEFLFGTEILTESFRCEPVESDDDLLGLLMGGIVVQADQIDDTYTTGDRFLFLHRTLAEYFAADFIVTQVIRERKKIRGASASSSKRLSCIRKFLELNLLTRACENVKYFVDSLILKHENTPEIFRTLPRLKELASDTELQKYLESDKVLLHDIIEVDCFDRTILHWAIEREKLSNISWFVTKCEGLTSRKDWFDATPFGYLIPKEEFQDAYGALANVQMFFERGIRKRKARCVLMAWLLVGTSHSFDQEDECTQQCVPVLSKYPTLQSVFNDKVRGIRQPSELYAYHQAKSEIVPLQKAPEEILKFAETLADLLLDLNVVIRRDDGCSPQFDLLEIFGDIDVEYLFETALTLNRERLVVKMYDSLLPVSAERKTHVESVFLDILQKDDFKNYKRILRSLETHDFVHDITMWSLIKKEHTLTFRSGWFNALYETQFTSVQRAYESTNVDEFLKEFLNCFHTIPKDHDARTKILGICDGALGQMSTSRDLTQTIGTNALLTLEFYDDEAKWTVVKIYSELFEKIVRENAYSEESEDLNRIVACVKQLLAKKGV